MAKRRSTGDDEAPQPRPVPLPLTIDDPGQHYWNDLRCDRLVSYCSCRGCRGGQSFAHWIYIGKHLFTLCDACCPVCRDMQNLQALEFDARCDLLMRLWDRYPALDDITDLTDSQAVLIETILRR